MFIRKIIKNRGIANFARGKNGGHFSNWPPFWLLWPCSSNSGYSTILSLYIFWCLCNKEYFELLFVKIGSTWRFDGYWAAILILCKLANFSIFLALTWPSFDIHRQIGVKMFQIKAPICHWQLIPPIGPIAVPEIPRSFLILMSIPMFSGSSKSTRTSLNLNFQNDSQISKWPQNKC